MSTPRKIAITIMSIVALIALYKAVVKNIEYEEQDRYGESTESSKFINILPEAAVIVLMLIGVGIVYKPSKE